VVWASWEINSHNTQRELYSEIPVAAYRWGFDPVNGESVSNEPEPLPEPVKEQIHFLVETCFPNRESITTWIKTNYAKNNDKEDWDYKLFFMLKDNRGQGLFSAQYFIKQSRDYAQWSQDYAKQSRDSAQWSQNYAQWSQNYAKLAETATGILDEMNIDKFIDYFMQNPNDYWSDRNRPREKEYTKTVKVEAKL
jgi:hypothetical protein